MNTNSLRNALPFAYLALVICMATAPIQAADLPDLKISAIRMHAGSLKAGQPFTLETIIANKGKARAPASITGLYLSADNHLVPHTDHLVGSQMVPSGLAPGRSMTLWSTVFAPPGLTTNTYHLGAVADLTKRVREANESNNKIISSVLTDTNTALRYSCSIQHALNFNRDQQGCVGYVRSMTLGTTTLKPDLSLTNPINPESDTLPVVGAISNFVLIDPATSPLYFGFAISEKNQKTVMQLMQSLSSNTQVTLEIRIDEYDPIIKSYNPAVYIITTNLSGLIDKSGEQLLLHVDAHPLANPSSPKVYPAYIGLTPIGCQPFGISASVNSKYTVPWGCASQ